MGCVRTRVLELTSVKRTVSIFLQSGSSGGDAFLAAAAGSDGSVIICGYFGYSYLAGEYSTSPIMGVALKLDSELNQVWRFEVRWGHVRTKIAVSGQIGMVPQIRQT